jgi:hypothetical protein
MSQTTLNYGYDGANVSRTLQPGHRAFDTIVHEQGMPLLDSEQNLLYDILSDKLQDQNNAIIQSGFLNPVDFQFNPAWSDKFAMSSCTAYVNGWRLDVLPFGDQYIHAVAATSGLGNQRWDFMFLEVWKTTLVQGATQHKPSATTIYKDGNVQNPDLSIPDDIKDPVVPFETTRRIQIQYRIRIQQNVLAPNQQNSNIFDGTTYAQGGAGAPISPFTFANQGSSTNDYGLFQAGNGDNASRAQLLSVDGYVYAIPIAFLFRRSIASYSDSSVNGQAAAINNITTGNSDRIDGLFYDSVASSDVIDLRHKVVVGNQVNYKQILDAAIRDLLTGNNNFKRKSTIQYESISTSPVSGYSQLPFLCDQTRYVWSDASQTVISNTARINIGDTNSSKDFYTSRASGSWQINDTITVKAPVGSPVGTIILGTDDSNVSTKPFVYRNNSATLINVAGSWTGTGTATAVFTINDASLGTSEIWIVYDVQYPVNQGLSFVPDTLLSLNYVNASAFPVATTSYIPHAGSVRAGTNLFNSSLYLSRNSKQINFTHANSSFAANYTVTSRNKQLQISPIISSTATVGGATRSIYVSNYDNSTKRVYLPFSTSKTWFIRGVYDAVSAGTEWATSFFTNQNPSLISGITFQHPTPNYSFASISSIVYNLTTQLLVTSGGNYYPVFRQDSGGNVNQFILVDSLGNVFTPPSSNPTDYLMSHSSLLTANIAAYTSNSDPAGNFIQLRNSASFTNGSQFWIDIDYIGEPHRGAQIDIAYQYLPYQGLVDNVGTILYGQLKSISGFVHTDGTANVSNNIDHIKYPKPLVTFLPTPAGIDAFLAGSSVTGVGNIGQYISSNVCYADAQVLDYSDTTQQPLKIDDIVSGAFNNLLEAMDRGGNDATTAKSIMLPNMSVANYKQAVIFGLAQAGTDVALQNELLLYVWTLTSNSATNQFSAGDVLHIGVDFFFIHNRLFVKNV